MRLPNKREGKSELESTVSDLQDAQSDLADVRYEAEMDQETLDSLRRERDELDEPSEMPRGDLEAIAAEVARLRERKW